MLKVTTILVDFACWSTVACVRNVALSPTKLLRFFWFLVFIAFCAAFIVQLVLIILKYLSYPSDTSTTIVFSSQPFPDVTFCSFNPFKLSVVEKGGAFSDINRMLNEYKNAENGTGTSNEFGFRGLNRFQRLDRANDLLMFLGAQLTDAQKAPALYKVDELVTECLFAGNTCDPGDITPIPDPVYGRCFVYAGKNTTITRAGLAHGLRLILTANLVDSLSFVSDYLPTTSRVGVRMTINEADQIMDLDNRGFNIGVGYQTSVALSKSRTERIKEPYGNCVDDMDETFNHYSELEYSIDACFTTCKQKKFVEKCGCANPAHRKNDNETWCSTPDHATCLATHRGDQKNAADANLDYLADCGCRNPCKESYFSFVPSVLTYPAFGYTVGVGTTDQNNQQKEEQEKSTLPTLPTTLPTTRTSTTAGPTSTSSRSSSSTTSACRSDFTLDPNYILIMATEKFNVRPSGDDPCKPMFECKTGIPANWWECWPCFYECPGTGGGPMSQPGYRIPTADYPTPLVSCRDFFGFARIKTSGSAPTQPSFDKWSWSNQNPSRDECASEKTAMTPTTTTPTITTTLGPTDDCYEMQQRIWNSNGKYWNSDFNLVTNPVPEVNLNDNFVNWWDAWPCSYPCGGGVRFPTNPVLGNIKCVDFFKCFSINTDKFTNKPTFSQWADGNKNPFDCTAMTNVKPPTSTGRKKRSAEIPTVQSMGMPGKGSCESWNRNFQSVDDCKTWYKKNGMIVNVYYESLEYQVLAEGASYSIPAAVNDLGGQAGLWLGLSVVSIVECIGLFFMILLFCITGKRLSMRPERREDELSPNRRLT